ncbi:PHD finger protein [Apostasia shenzhenica]|uniref:PHD finger protein n=1 Tax=Apostasia shenzhenica TaxID=1088818 RepID=A0A2I0A4L1_9ASPA|nr:PHD finger protein [Apostasia shenzhenica]
MGDEGREGAGPAAEADCAPKPPPAKKMRGREAELRRVAEIVMVLSAMAEMRAGKEPTAAERALAGEARERLARACEEVRPKDLFPSEAVRGVVEDLGLNRSRDPVLAIRQPKLSIAERVQHTKKKMEESKGIPTSPLASQLHSVTFSKSSESHGSQRFFSGKQSPMVLTAGGFPSTHVPALASTMSSVKQITTIEAQPAIGKSSLGNDLHSLSTSNVEVSHQRLDTQINGSTYFTLGSAAAANYLSEKVSASGLSTSVALAAQSQAKKLEGNLNVGTIHASQKIIRNHDMKSPLVQATQAHMVIGNQSSQGVTFLHAHSFISKHNEIAKNLMSMVQPKVPDLLNLSPPSIEYMNKPINCQVCKMIITDMESLLICDNCDKGTHLKCLQSYVTKAITKAEWHCPKCLVGNNGKPFPPKYGRVTRNILVAKPSTSGGRTTLEKKGESLVPKVNNPKLVENDKSCLFLLPQTSKLGGSVGESVGASEDLVQKYIKGSSSDSKKPDDRLYFGTTSSHLEEKLEVFCIPTQTGNSEVQNGRIELSMSDSPRPVCDSELDSSDKKSMQSKLSTSEVQGSIHETMPDMKQESKNHYSDQKQGVVVNITCQPWLQGDAQGSSETNMPINTGAPSGLLQTTVNSSNNDSKESPIDLDSSGHLIPEIRQDVEHRSLVIHKVLGNGSGTANCGTAGEGLQTVDWVGDFLEIVENRTYYKSCCVNGTVIKLQDYVLVSTENRMLCPTKLLSLWEDNETLSKLATISQYYLPSNLLDLVSQPSAPEKDEVYASDKRITISVILIRGLCDVLPEEKFRKEIDRRLHLGDEADGLHPIFLCKWMFDEAEGIFQSPTSVS